MRNYRDLDAWKVGAELLKEIYKLTPLLPNTEKFGISSQMSRAAASILANFAEGCGRYTYADKTNKFVISRGECSEVEAFIFMTIDVGFLKPEQCARALALVQQERKILSGLIKSTRSRI